MPEKQDYDDWDTHWGTYNLRAEINPAQKMRFKWLQNQVRGLSRGSDATLLDIGCGVGDLLSLLSKSEQNLTLLGVDYSQTGVDITTKKTPSVKARAMDLIAAPAEPQEGWGKAELATCSEVIEHVDDPVLLMKNVRPLLAEGAQVLVTVPGGPVSNFDRHIGHRQHFTPESLDEVMLEAGFKRISSGRIGFPFFDLYRYLVILRSDQISKVADGPPPWYEVVASNIFNVLFKLNVNSAPLGLQIVGHYRLHG